MKTVRIGSIILAIMLFAGFSQINAQTIHEEWVYDVTCADGLWVWCLEEPVDGTVIYHVVNRFDKDGNVKGFHANVKGGKFVGCVSGTVYKTNGSWNETTMFNDNNGQQVWNYTDNTNFIGKKGQKFTVVFKGKLTVNANGEIKRDYYAEVMCD